MNDLAAIPTLYGGVQFRSRIEARWAAFFDRLGVRWRYEVIDLEGYIPDFLIDQFRCGARHDGGGGRVLVEVKGHTTLGALHSEARSLARFARPELPIVVVGSVWHAGEVGVLIEVEQGKVALQPAWAEACQSCFGTAKAGIAFQPMHMYTGSFCDDGERSAALDEDDARWLAAGNDVQWPAPR